MFEVNNDKIFIFIENPNRNQFFPKLNALLDKIKWIKIKNDCNSNENRKVLIIGRINRLKPCDNHVYLLSRLRMSWYQCDFVSVLLNCLLCSIKKRIVIKRYENVYDNNKVDLKETGKNKSYASLSHTNRGEKRFEFGEDVACNSTKSQRLNTLPHTHNIRVIKKIYISKIWR